MKPFYILLLFISITFSLSCNSKHGNESDAEIPEVVDATKFKMTECVPTLENSVSENKNVVYASSLLFAWDEVERLLKSQAVAGGANSVDFKMFVNSTSYVNSLQKGEYETEVNAGDDGIVANASFKVALPFWTSLQSVGKINFGGKKVNAFGLRGHSYMEGVSILKILYYLDDDHFVIELIPKNYTHEIILAKGISNSGTLADMIHQSEVLIDSGKVQSKDSLLSWKYVFNDIDFLGVPVIKFNIEQHYVHLENQHFNCENGKPHFIAQAYQRTSFLLDENGATVESVASVLVDSMGMPPPIPPQPKKLILDKPYLVYCKRNDCVYPYFVLKVENSELMVEK